MKYGTLPIEIGFYKIVCKEMMFYQYLPIKLANNGYMAYEKRLDVFKPLISEVISDLSVEQYYESYIYITAKHVYVDKEHCGNRPGWHSDGFLSDDLNYIWCDSNPTVFAELKDGFNLTPDHELSLPQMERQADNYAYPVTYEPFALLKLDQYVIHKAPDRCISGYRTFVKISVSKYKYNLKGNSINHLLDYKWDYQPRKKERNHPIAKP